MGRIIPCHICIVISQISADQLAMYTFEIIISLIIRRVHYQVKVAGTHTKWTQPLLYYGIWTEDFISSQNCLRSVFALSIIFNQQTYFLV